MFIYNSWQEKNYCKKIYIITKTIFVININSKYIHYINVEIIFSPSQFDALILLYIYLHIWQKILSWKYSSGERDLWLVPFYCVICLNFKTGNTYTCYIVIFIKYLIMGVSTKNSIRTPLKILLAWLTRSCLYKTNTSFLKFMRWSKYESIIL